MSAAKRCGAASAPPGLETMAFAMDRQASAFDEAQLEALAAQAQTKTESKRP